ncbi:MAG: hypothetical protein N4A61_11060 [Pelagimonas sp.]|jgi:hypothetical protein|nr:hypothetical protein [Pelagimonas sp.]
MFKPISVLVVSAVVLTSCGAVRDSRMNPFNWFGGSRSEPVTTETDVNPLIPASRQSIFRSETNPDYQGWDVSEVVALSVDKRPGGAIINATGRTERQGAFELKLVKIDAESDAKTLTYAFQAIQVPGPRGSDQSRTLTAAVALTDQELLGIRTIRVKAKNNMRVARR